MNKCAKTQLRIAPHRRAQIIAALKANPNAARVARETGAVHATVWKIARRERIHRRQAQSHLEPDKRAKIVAALKATPDVLQVVKQVGNVSHVTVWKIARAEGIRLANTRPRVF